MIQSDPGIAHESLCGQMKRLIVHPLKESSISTVIVIDALDECEDEEPASAILSVIGRMAAEIPQVKFFLTGRPEPQISKGFRLPLLAKITDIFILHKVKPDQVNHDIQLFFKSSFLELVDVWPGLGNWPTKGQLDELCKRAAGLFVYAAAAVKFISNNQWSPTKQLEILLGSQDGDADEWETLDSLYTSILQQAFKSRKPGYYSTVCSVLGAVILATNPLSPSTIARLLRFNPEDVFHLLSLANSFLVLQDIDHPTQPFHKSFPDFITDPIRCANKRFHIHPPDHHSELLVACINLMDQMLEKNMCQLPDAVANSDVGDLKERVDNYINPALQYACMSWHTHLIGIHIVQGHTSAITSILHKFLETKFLFWLEVLSVLGAVRNAVDALQATQHWLEVCKVSILEF